MNVAYLVWRVSQKSCTHKTAIMPLQAAALRRRRAMQRQVLYTKPVTAEAGKPVQASSSPMTCLG